MLAAVAPDLPELVGGSADLTPSNNTYQQGAADVSATEPGGKNFFFGVREHAMGAALNGMALSGLLRPYGGTFLIFSDYMRPAIRLAALMELPAIYVFTHDSIFLGEDGPTHQPVSQLLSLRAIPNLTVLRPGDANETSVAWHVALERRDGPTALVAQPPEAAGLRRNGKARRRGRAAWRLRAGRPGGRGAARHPHRHRLGAARWPWRRTPNWPRKECRRASSACRPGSCSTARARPIATASCRPRSAKRVAIEAGVPLGWERYVGPKGVVMGVDRFGASAPAADLADEYLLTQDEVVRRVRQLLED